MSAFVKAVPHRVFEAWCEFLEAEYDRPSRTDYFIARAGAAAHYSNRKHPQKLDLKPFVPVFGTGGPAPETAMTEVQEAAVVKARHLAVLGPNVVRVKTLEGTPYERDRTAELARQIGRGRLLLPEDAP